ncbi:MAG TPA: M23 family metallopeptidase [Acidimicrobiia bacterium]|nr:M23 family metallopeptidase [Acidimicrobiia bacterium]
MTRRAGLLMIFLLVLPLPALGQAEPPVPDLAPGVVAEELHLAFPQDPDVTWFLDTFGARRGGGHVHIGVDLHAPKGSPVYAIAPGIVTRVSIGQRAGAYIQIDHGPTWNSWYMHLNTDEPGTNNRRGGFATALAPGIEVGVFVDAGQLIGYVGDSGNAEGTVPHTHFELHRNGRAIDPFPMLVEAQERALMAAQALRLAELATRIL